MIENLLINNLPSIDLHGLDGDIATILARDFVNDHFKMKTRKVVIVHGKGEGILRKRVHEMLKTHPKVLHYQLHAFNDGITVIDIKSE